MNEFIAHVRRNPNGDCVTQSLEDHLNAVAKSAGEFAATFGNKDWGELLGYWHDLGKFLPAWQSYLARETGCNEEAHIEGIGNRPNHSSAGAVLAFDKVQSLHPGIHKIARLIAYGIAGHHAGLPDAEAPSIGADLANRVYKNPLDGILNLEEIQKIKELPEAKRFLEMDIPQSSPCVIKKSGGLEAGKEYIHLWQRMLFSCLVDADFLDTEKFMDEERSAPRGKYLQLEVLKERFNTFMQEERADTPINKKRNGILNECRSKASSKPGFFSLNVPTGGGKTLSSMAFALEHALRHHKNRIIMAIPYTSIIEQTAKVFKYGADDNDEISKRMETGKVLFGEDQVVEHHSNLDPDKEDSKSRLATENWDAPIIVTTNVQLFESLFASRTSSCRKLHNLVNSVIILDEAQMLPPEYLRPILSVLRGLVEHFGVTVVLMTATQPALEGQIGSAPNSFEGLTNVTPIIDDPDELARHFHRVKISIPPDLNERSEWADIAAQLKKHDQALCIVNTRTDCRKLHELMPEGTIHLSANMCGEERSEIISEIKIKLRNNDPVRVISTQLVEAGVDIDFPVVYRALAGLDSIAQAAGRCNRENKLAREGKQGQVTVFNPPKAAPPGLLRKGEDAARTILRTHDVKELTPALFTEYFQQFYPNLNGFDKPHFHDLLVKEAEDFKFQFRTLAQDFKLIDDPDQRSVVVWFESVGKDIDSRKLIEKLRYGGPNRWLIRKLQRFIVNVRKPCFDRILKYNYVEEFHGYWVQSDPMLYKRGLGILCNEGDWVFGSGVV